MTTRKDSDAASVPTASPDPACNTGYAEPKPKTPGEAQIPGATPEPDPEEGGLDRETDPQH